jgi:hypothetical protein
MTVVTSNHQSTWKEMVGPTTLHLPGWLWLGHNGQGPTLKWHHLIVPHQLHTNYTYSNLSTSEALHFDTSCLAQIKNSAPLYRSNACTMTSCTRGNILILHPSSNICYVWFFISTLIIYFIKNKVFKKIKYKIKLLYVINPIIFDFYNIKFLINTNDQNWHKNLNGPKVRLGRL